MLLVFVSLHCLILGLAQGLDANFDVNGYYCDAFRRITDAGKEGKQLWEYKERSERVLSSPEKEVN